MMRSIGPKPTAIDMVNYYMIMGPQHRRELVAELERQAPVDEDARVALQRIREQWPT